ncbi:hypothetical protein MHK_008550 [Candidatus Magnetomorum sp. HK-1]|nr:hypothetical protein MHK_008550 [Candidatus Magnetomorum sp. HK-1]
MLEIVKSKNTTPIRLTDERWSHITEEHAELAGMKYEVLETVAKPSKILAGNKGELLAIRYINHLMKHLVVAYRETSENDGFIITSFITSKETSLNRRKQLWPN